MNEKLFKEYGLTSLQCGGSNHSFCLNSAIVFDQMHATELARASLSVCLFPCVLDHEKERLSSNSRIEYEMLITFLGILVPSANQTTFHHKIRNLPDA
jgi:hypothetical protein